MANDERNLETIPTGALGLIPLASCTELGEKVNQYLVKWRDTRHNAHKDNIALSPRILYCKCRYPSFWFR